MHNEAFIAECKAALTWIGTCLASVQMDFGATDFPQDGGVAHRNRLYNYACSYFGAVFHTLAPESLDEWKTRNEQHVLGLRADALIKMTGLSHFHAAGSVLFNTVTHARRNSPINPNGLPLAGKLLRSNLDWLLGAYRLPDHVAIEWLKMITSAGDIKGFMEQAQAFFYSELSYAIGLDPTDKANSVCWSGLAIMADYGAFQRPAEELNQLCNKHFAVYCEEAKRWRQKD
jgi:hypothetical protein